MKSSEYWVRRFALLEEAQNRLARTAAEELDGLYRQAERELEEKIAVWYQRFAKNNDITMAEARKRLLGRELTEFKWDVKEYIKHGEENALSGEWMKELENASARFHVSRLEALKLRTRQSVEALFGRQESAISSAMAEIYRSDYYHTAYELQRGLNLGFDVAKPDEPYIAKVLSKPWAADGSNFSERIWKSRDKLVSELHSELTRNIMLGADPQKAIDAISKKLNTSRYNAGRLVMTEEAYFSSVAQKDCFSELGVEKYEIVATLDSHTSDICRGLDGKVYDMKDYEAGVTAPPFHVFCRSTTVPHFDDDFGQVGERAARDADGKTYYVPDNMTFGQWMEKQDELYGKGSVDKTRKMRYNESANLKQFDRYRELLGGDAPGTLKAFQELKYGDEAYYSYMKLDYQRQNKLINHPEFALPNADKATADDRKFTEYLFNPDNPRGMAKGHAFTDRLGYSKDNYEELRNELLKRAEKYPTVLKGNNGYGDRYEQKIVLYGKKGTPANVVVAWLVDEDGTKMTSVYIKEVD
ncbi:MAG: minor capsid protein [Oscillospiraceae bacterium]|nr:minor capsid protein [Oscillospiraceae bacterium]